MYSAGTRIKLINNLDGLSYPIGTTGTILNCEGSNNNPEDPDEVFYRIQFDDLKDNNDFSSIWYAGHNNIAVVEER